MVPPQHSSLFVHSMMCCRISQLGSKLFNFSKRCSKRGLKTEDAKNFRLYRPGDGSGGLVVSPGSKYETKPPRKEKDGARRGESYVGTEKGDGPPVDKIAKLLFC